MNNQTFASEHVVHLLATPRRTVNIARACRTPSGRPGVVSGEFNNRVHVKYTDLDGGAVSLPPNLVTYVD